MEVSLIKVYFKGYFTGGVTINYSSRDYLRCVTIFCVAQNVTCLYITWASKQLVTENSVLYYKGLLFLLWYHVTTSHQKFMQKSIKSLLVMCI